LRGPAAADLLPALIAESGDVCEHHRAEPCALNGDFAMRTRYRVESRTVRFEGDESSDDLVATFTNALAIESHLSFVNAVGIVAL
jgi:hypothetical protein